MHVIRHAQSAFLVKYQADKGLGMCVVLAVIVLVWSEGSDGLDRFGSDPWRHQRSRMNPNPTSFHYFLWCKKEASCLDVNWHWRVAG